MGMGELNTGKTPFGIVSNVLVSKDINALSISPAMNIRILAA